MTDQDMKNIELLFQRHIGTLTEYFQGNMDLVVEGHETLRNEIRETRTELKQDIELCNFKIDTLNMKIDGVEANLTKKIDGVAADLKATDARLSKKIDGVEAGLTKKIDGVEAGLTKKIDGVEANLTKKIDGVAADLKAHRSDTEAHHGVYRVKES